jgi:hypothetical protein
METYEGAQPAAERKELQCQVCGYRWYPKGNAEIPIRCASTTCRSKRWNVIHVELPNRQEVR